MTGRPLTPITLGDAEREQLESMSASRSLPHGLVTRARIVLEASAGRANKNIARKLRLDPGTVSKWRRRFVEQGIEGLHDELRPGRPRSIVTTVSWPRTRPHPRRIRSGRRARSAGDISAMRPATAR